jgi:hypothetical protein
MKPGRQGNDPFPVQGALSKKILYITVLHRNLEI